MFKNLALCLFVAITCMVLGIEGAFFEFETRSDRNTFVVEIKDEAKIQEARDILAGKEKERTHIMGRIKKVGQAYNPRHDFHIDPDTVQFFDHAIEVCDAPISYVDDNLDEVCGVFLPGCFWCPWDSTLTREITN